MKARISCFFLLVFFFVQMVKGEDDTLWQLHASDINAPYVGAPMANGGIGILPWKEPFSVRQVILNHVFDTDGPQGVSRVLKGINPFLMSMDVDGKEVNTECITNWKQCVDMKEATHNSSFRAAGKVDVGYSICALRNMPYAGLIRVELKALSDVSQHFVQAKAQMGSLYMSEALLYPARSAEFEVGTKNVMSVDVPTIKYTGATTDDETRVPYAFTFTSAELDNAVVNLTSYLPDLLELAEVEKTCNMLADEIEKTRRRVNALEYVMIPEMQENIKYITMKLSENERASTVRLMKAKEIMAK